MDNSDNTKNQRTYKTSDIALATTLILHGESFLYVEPIHKRHGHKSEIFHFVFKDSENRENLVVKYSSNHEEIKVLPSAFRQTMRYLKEMTKTYNKEIKEQIPVQSQ